MSVVKFRLAKEGGHSARRILHAKDATGKEIERALSEAVKSHPRITLKRNTLAIDLIQKTHGNPADGIAGVWCLDQISGEVITYPSDAIILATGGLDNCGRKQQIRLSLLEMASQWHGGLVHVSKTWHSYNFIQLL